MDGDFSRLSRYNKSWVFLYHDLHITKINEIKTLVLEKLGLNYFGFLRRTRWPVTKPDLHAFCNYPSELVRHYCEGEYWKIDPRFNSMGDQDYMIWNHAFQKNTHMHELLIRQGGMKDGVTYCFPLQDGSVAYMSFAGESMFTHEQAQAMCADAYLICKTAIRVSGLKINNMPVVDDLSPHQLIILRLTADGMTTREVAKEMSLTKAAIDYHLKVIGKKMNCQNKPEIIAKTVFMHLL